MSAVVLWCPTCGFSFGSEWTNDQCPEEGLRRAGDDCGVMWNLTGEVGVTEAEIAESKFKRCDGRLVDLVEAYEIARKITPAEWSYLDSDRCECGHLQALHNWHCCSFCMEHWNARERLVHAGELRAAARRLIDELDSMVPESLPRDVRRRKRELKKAIERFANGMVSLQHSEQDFQLTRTRPGAQDQTARWRRGRCRYDP